MQMFSKAISDAMSIKVKVRMSEFDKLKRRVDGIKVNDVLYPAGLHLQSKMQIMPPKQAGKFSATATTKQKRKYWAMVSRGLVRHGGNGYIRTGKTAAAWTTKKIGATAVEVGNASPGAFFVYSEEKQQPFVDTFPRVDKVVNAERGKVQKIVDEAIAKLLR